MADPYSAKIGLETEVRIFTDPGYDNIPYATAITMPGIVFDTLDSTTNSSPNGFREFVPGLADGGEVTFTLMHHPDEATHAALWAAQQAREVMPFQVAMPQFEADNLFDFEGFVTGLPIDSPHDGLVTRAVTIKITGNIEMSTE